MILRRIGQAGCSILVAALVVGCPGGGGDDSSTAQPKPVLPAPTISGVSPKPVNGSNEPQDIAVFGSGFVDKPTVTLSWTGTSGHRLPSAQVTFVTNTQLRISITTMEVADDWTVKVTNPDGQSSNVAPFSVVVPNQCSPELLAVYRDRDDYRYKTPTAAHPTTKCDPNDPNDKGFSVWGFCYRNCTDFVAWRMNRDAGTEVKPYFFTNGMGGGLWGNAENWDENATTNLKYWVDDRTPAVGAIAHWNSGDPGIPRNIPGHVAYVEGVNSDGSVDVSEYNYKELTYSVRCNVRPPRFIHVAAMYAVSSAGVLYNVKLSASGTETAIGVIRTAAGMAPPLTDLALTPQGQLYGITFSALFRIDPATAVATQIGSGLGIGAAMSSVALVSDARGNLYAATFDPLFDPFNGLDGSLIRIDAESGVATVVGPFGSRFGADGDLAFSPDGTLYATVNAPGSRRSVLVTVDRSSGLGTRIGSPSTDTGFDDIFSLFYFGAKLYGLSADGSGGWLLRIDTTTGAASPVRRVTFAAH